MTFSSSPEPRPRRQRLPSLTSLIPEYSLKNKGAMPQPSSPSQTDTPTSVYTLQSQQPKDLKSRSSAPSSSAMHNDNSRNWNSIHQYSRPEPIQTQRYDLGRPQYDRDLADHSPSSSLVSRSDRTSLTSPYMNASRSSSYSISQPSPLSNTIPPMSNQWNAPYDLSQHSTQNSYQMTGPSSLSSSVPSGIGGSSGSSSAIRPHFSPPFPNRASLPLKSPIYTTAPQPPVESRTSSMHNGLRPYEPLQSPRIGLPYHHEEAPPMNYRDNTYGGTFSANGYLNHNAPAATSPIEYSQRRPSLPTAAQHHATPYDRQVSTGGFHPPVPSSQSHSYSQPGQQVYQEYTMGDASKPKRRRGNLPKSTTALLRTWLYDHTNHPYPSEDEKNQLAAQTGLMINQISNWFINARRRILQPSDMQKGLMQQSHASQNGSVQSTASQPRIHNAASQGPYVSQPRSPSQHASSVVLQPPYER